MPALFSISNHFQPQKTQSQKRLGFLGLVLAIVKAGFLLMGDE
jgi:hypothetical protein